MGDESITGSRHQENTDAVVSRRRISREVIAGNIGIGGSNPVRIQSMTSTPTLDTVATVEQILRIARAGADLVRMTVRNIREAENLQNIKSKLHLRECFIPLIADVHFNPAIAETAAAIVSKVRINPGNYGISQGRAPAILSEEAYKEELSKAGTAFSRLLEICRKHGTALRIGVNHGSLSPRIISRYGNTPEGMANSAMEFLRFCSEKNFHQVVVSLKSSNTRVMVHANRLFAGLMEKEGMQYPLHLGVTEAGEGEDGRIRSAAGIGTLLWEGIGDTIRVSLTEDPENEVPVARKLLDYIEKSLSTVAFSTEPFRRRFSHPVGNIGGENVPVVIVDNCSEKQKGTPAGQLAADYINYTSLPLVKEEVINPGTPKEGPAHFMEISYDSLTDALIEKASEDKNLVFIAIVRSGSPPEEMKRLLGKLKDRGCLNPVIFKKEYNTENIDDFQIEAAADFAPLFLDGYGDGIWLVNKKPGLSPAVVSAAFSILQSARARTTKTEFISCPSCGRTMFNIQEATLAVKKRLSHLKGLKIAVMGCIVNGPGEMADSDYGYVGSASRKVTLYKKQSVMKRNVPEDKAVDELISLIKENGDWYEEV